MDKILMMCSKCHNIILMKKEDLRGSKRDCTIAGCDGRLFSIFPDSPDLVNNLPMIALKVWAITNGYSIHFNYSDLDLENMISAKKAYFSIQLCYEKDKEEAIKTYMERYTATHSSPIFKIANITGLEYAIHFCTEEIKLKVDDPTHPSASIIAQLADLYKLFWRFVEDFCYGMDDYNI